MIPITLNNDQNRIVGMITAGTGGTLLVTFADDFVCTKKMFAEMFDGGFFIKAAEYVGPNAEYRILEAEIVSFNVDQPVDSYEWTKPDTTITIEETYGCNLPTDDLSVARRIWNAIRRKKHRRLVIMDDTNPSGFRLILSYKARICDVEDENSIGIFSNETSLYIIERAVKKYSSKKRGPGQGIDYQGW